MSETLGNTVSLGVRMLVAFLFVGIIALTVAGLAVFVLGGLVYAGIVVFMLAGGIFVKPLIDGTALDALWPPTGSAVPVIIVVTGTALAYRYYGDAVRAEVKQFEAELGTRGQRAEDYHPEIAAQAKRLAQRADLPVPAVRIVDRSRPESYALADSDGGTILVSQGVIDQLDDSEVEAVLAHEVSHLANRDSHIMRWLLIPMLVAEHIGSESPSYEKGRPIGNSPELYHEGTPIIGYLGHVVGLKIVRAVTFVQVAGCQLGVAALSRGREFAADRGAAELTGSPAALASALEKLDTVRSRPDEDRRDFRRTAGVIDILPAENNRRIDGPFRTHPNTATRIERLESLVTES